MLFGRIALLLGGEHLKGADHAEAGVARFDDVVDVAVLSSVVGVGEKVGVFLFLLFLESCGIFVFLGFLGIEHAYSTFGSHHCDFGGRPGVVHIAAELLAAHHDVASAVALAQSHSNLRHSSLTVSVKQLGTVKDNAVVLLTCAGEEARNVNQCYQRDIEGIAEAYETGSLA